MYGLRVGVFALLLSVPVAAEAQENDESLAEQLANPISSLISAPFQYNYDCCYGHVITVDFNYDGGGVGKGGQATLTVDGEKVASDPLPQTIPYRMSLDETLDIGEDTGTPISEDYAVPFKFNGTLNKVTINITEEKLTEEQLEQYRQGRVKSAIAQ
jgi:hypothetical protein